MSTAYVRAIALGIFLIIAGVAYSPLCDEVGERAPSPSHGVTIDTPRPGSEAAPARSLADGNGEDVVPVEQVAVQAVQPEPASTVTQSALTATATVVIDSVPATPVATSRAVETIAPKSINSYDPWPAYLWPVVECLIQRESGGNPGAVGAAGERGLMQVGVANFTYLAERGIPPDSLFDPATNIRAGWMIYLYWQNATGDGFWPWKSTRGGCS